METRTEREPLFITYEDADEIARQVCSKEGCEGGSHLSIAKDAARAIAQMVNDKITSGTLRMVETIKREDAKEHVLKCKSGMHDAMDTYFYDYIHYCPGCGKKIVPDP